ncbi:DNA/RNA nuclease SfsA [Sporosalibacterium faouarense]|uniref:DNA/RNA nuclease SfsA n=1 Tax=Sporosalibacterium faouarense TaxID=516123 RepID=UPI00192AD1DF|nr:DNA/RNA nuclease SfsA [Sporosalibacterium faouarense]
MKIDFEGNLLEGVFKKRLNRFLAEIIVDGNLEMTHVPNTGRMKELLTEGARIIVRKVNSETRKTNFDLLMVYYNNILVSIDSKLPNTLLYKAFKDRQLSFFQDYDDVKKEVVYGNSRLDIGLLGPKKRSLIEAKCVTFVENGIAKFPDAPTTRGTKHVYELIDAKEHGIEAGIIFVIQRNDAKIFRPNWDMDPDFSAALEKAKNSGVLIKALLCKVTNKSIFIESEIKIII